MGSSALTLKVSRMYHQDVFRDPMLSSVGNGSQRLSATWGNLRREVAENSLSSNDPFVADLAPDPPKLQFLPTKHVQKIQNNLTEIVKGKSVEISAEGVSTPLVGFGLVHTNPELFKTTIVGLDASADGTQGTVEEYASFEAGPSDKITWRCFNLPKYGQVLGFTAPSKMTPWIKFKILSTNKTNLGNLAVNKIWEIIGIPCDPPSDPNQVTMDISETQEKATLKRKIQVVSVLRPAKRLKFQKTADDEEGTIVVEGQKFTDVPPDITKRILGLLKAHGKQDGTKN